MMLLNIGDDGLMMELTLGGLGDGMGWHGRKEKSRFDVQRSKQTRR
jgi:hypothetical protein